MAKKVKRIGDVQEVERLIKRSNKKPVFIFKHDPGVQESEDAYQEYLDYIEDTEEEILFTVVHVREENEASEAIEELLEVVHDVPQLILVMDEEVVWDDVKENINQSNIMDVVNEYVTV